MAASKVLAKAGISFDEAALRLLGVGVGVGVGVSNGTRDVTVRGHTSNNNSNNSRNNNINGNKALSAAVSLSSSSSSVSAGGLGGAFVNSPALTSLRVYLSETLGAQSPANKSQRTMLATWLCEIFLHQITCASLFPAATTTNSSNSNNSSSSSSSSVGVNGNGSAINRVGLTSSGGVLQTEAELMAAFKQFLRSNKLVEFDSVHCCLSLNMILLLQNVCCCGIYPSRFVCFAFVLFCLFVCFD